MPRLRIATLCLTLLATPAFAETPMTGEEFEAYVTGRTLTYGIDGLAYGVEQYLQGRRVLWAFLGEECMQGRWYEDESRICFAYEADGSESPHCWTFFLTPEGLRARFEGDGPVTELVEVEQSPTPLMCPGPEVGA